MADTVRFGLVGYGAWGGLHARSIGRTDGAELVAVAARTEDSRNRASEDHPGVAVHEDWRDLVARDDVDVVDVVVPNHLHHEVAAAALNAGKHVLLEKPMCLRTKDCVDLLRRAEAADRRIALGHELRLSHLWGRVTEAITSGTIGEPRYVLVELSRRPYRPGADGWRFDPDRVGNWVLEEPIHFFDLARWYLGRNPTSTFATASSRDPAALDRRDNFSAIVHFPEGTYAVVTQTLAAFQHHQTVKVTGTQGAVWASWSGVRDRTEHPEFFLRVFDGEEVDEQRIEGRAGEVFELEAEIAMTRDVVRGEGTIAATGLDGLWSVAMCEAAERSVETGEVVGFDNLVPADYR